VEDYLIAKQQLLKTYQNVRDKTAQLCQPLAIEDYVIQSAADVSPPKWHLAHTTWFFETFILAKYLSDYQYYQPLFNYLFNSYYQSLGKTYPREQRGLLSRPTVATIYAYRDYVDNQLSDFIDQSSEQQFAMLQPLIVLGINHEQQHQELLLMDIKHNFSQDPDFPIYQSNHILSATPHHKPLTKSLEFVIVTGGIIEIGHRGSRFCFDNELPYHQKIVKPYLIATRLVTNNEYLEFIDAGCYRQPQWWLSDGWDFVQKNHWHAPLYWQKIVNKWHVYTLSGLKTLNPAEPVSHISYYEADAYARWRGQRLPLEEEWEYFVTSNNLNPAGHFMESGIYHPQVITNHDEEIPQQVFGDLWEWTASAYCPYPGFKPLQGPLGEYNGKFMNNQMVMRGGCCVTPQSHIRASYRNFFQPDKRWQFSSIRLASDA
jgi:ergothioneine biosynthesis protein EgtB